jgi:spermidine synthase
MTKTWLVFNLILKGFSSIIIQSLLLRELLVIFHGNELTVGLILCLWLLGGAAGSILASFFGKFYKNTLRLFVLFQILSIIYFPFAIFLIRLSHTFLNVAPTEMLSLGSLIGITISALGFLGCFDGALFTCGVQLLSENIKENKAPMAKFYLFESLGIITGGILFTFFFLGSLNSFQIAFLVSIFSSLAAFGLTIEDKRLAFKIAPLVLSVLFAVSFKYSLPIQKATLEQEWKEKNIASYENSLYGNIVVGHILNQYTLFYDGLPLASIPNSEAYFTQDFIHLPLLTRDRVDNILFIGNAFGGPLTEALKYQPQKIIYAEIDPILIKTLSHINDATLQHELKNPRVHIETQDARNFVKRSKEKFDCVFVNTALPTSLVLNRYATQEFFNEVKNILKPNGIAVFKTWGSLSALNKELKDINASLFKTLKSIYPEIVVIPGDGFNLFIASNTNIDLSVDKMTRNLSNFQLKTYLINPEYLKLRLDPVAREWFSSSIKNTLARSRLNQDLWPNGLYKALRVYYVQHSKKMANVFEKIEKIKSVYIFAGLAGLLLIFWIFVMRKNRNALALRFTVFSTGIFTMSMQITTLFLFQSLLGYLFKWVAILTTSFMVGTSLGAILASKKIKLLSSTKNIAKIDAILATTAALLCGAIIIFSKNTLSLQSLAWLFSLLSISLGILVGLEIPLVCEIFNQINKKPAISKSSSIAGQLYSLDLLGACLGALLTPLMLIPSCGIITTVFLLYFIKIANACFIYFLKKT